MSRSLTAKRLVAFTTGTASIAIAPRQHAASPSKVAQHQRQRDNGTSHQQLPGCQPHLDGKVKVPFLIGVADWCVWPAHRGGGEETSGETLPGGVHVQLITHSPTPPSPVCLPLGLPSTSPIHSSPPTHRITHAREPSGFSLPMGARVRRQEATGRPTSWPASGSAKRKSTVGLAPWVSASLCTSLKGRHSSGLSAGATALASATPSGVCEL